MVNIPIVTLDKIFINVDDKDIFFIDCTRINRTNEITSRRGEQLDKQIERLSKVFDKKEIILADDVIFSGSVLKNIISRFNSYGVNVVGVIASITSRDAYSYFNSNLKYGVRANYIMDDSVIDQVCERDFYFGIAGSGIMINTDRGLLKAPYFLPYGNPNERASIPVDDMKEFSYKCLDRSKYLWEEIDKLKQIKTKISELPERIINTNSEDEVVKTLKKEMNNL